ncbi:MAG: translation initiation factor IF-2 [Puniceicoccales bacterium]|jgi:translation initiation factor IF-2|nr:translation initiation factor IF-2 [Puniceicoccales bacterium]
MSVRVYQLAKQLELDSKLVVQLLRERGLDVNGPSNSIPSVYADALVEEMSGKARVIGEKIIVKTADGQGISEKNGKSSGADGKGEAEIYVSNSSESVIGGAGLANGFETREVPASPRADARRETENRPRFQAGKSTFQSRNRDGRQKNRGMVSIGCLDKTPRKNGDVSPACFSGPLKSEPIVPEMQELESQPSDAAQKFKPFLKKIERQPAKLASLQTIEVKIPVVVRTLATQINVKPFQLISKLMSMNVFASMNQEIDLQIAQNVAEKFGYNLELAKPEPEKEAKVRPLAKKSARAMERKQNLSERPPVICVLGHVDHGKTTLLDAIRHTRVAAGEVGGITQHVAAYQVEQSGKKITFIDTPGHAAFSKMRERGANLTDIGILVVAADDGFMPQTDEALKFAKNANIPIVVAINKIDAKGANIDKVKQQMQQRGIISEDWGGEVLCSTISALHGTNIEHLLEMVRLQAEIMELRADATDHPDGVILEARVSIGHGATASAIVQDGTLKIGDCIICGPCYCKVKSLTNDRGEQIKEAPPSTPVSVIGWSGMPEVGVKFTFVDCEKSARKKAEENALELKKNAGNDVNEAPKISSVDQLFSAIAAVEEKILNVILRADTHGSAEALRDFLDTIKSKKIKLNILDCGVGAINKNDITMAATSKAQIVAFNAKMESNAQVLAKQLGVRIIHHNIIYELVGQVREAMANCLDAELRESKLGAAEVRQIFNIKNSIIAGCMVTEGRIVRDKFVRLIRKKEIVFQGKFASIKRQKEDAGEVRAGFECGIVIAGFEAFEIGDIVECFEIQKFQPSL